MRNILIKLIAYIYHRALVKRFYSDIIVVETDDMLVFYFSVEGEVYAKSEEIDLLLKKLDKKFNLVLNLINIFTGFDYIFNFFDDWETLEQQAEYFNRKILIGKEDIQRRVI